MDNNLGKYEKTIKPNLGYYFKQVAITIIALVVVMVFDDFYKSNSVYNRIIILAPILFVVFLVRLIIASLNKTNIEMYEYGVKLGDFSALYKDLTFQKQIGTFKLNDTYSFKSGNTYAEFKHPITKKDYELIVNTIKTVREQTPITSVAKNLSSDTSDSLYNIKIIREKSYVGSIVDYQLTLNGDDIGGILNDSTKTVQTPQISNRLTFSNNDVTKTIYFEIILEQTAVIVIKTNSFLIKKCTGCIVVEQK